MVLQVGLSLENSGALQAGAETCIVATDPVGWVSVACVRAFCQRRRSRMLVDRVALVDSASGTSCNNRVDLLWCTCAGGIFCYIMLPGSFVHHRRTWQFLENQRLREKVELDVTRFVAWRETAGPVLDLGHRLV